MISSSTAQTVPSLSVKPSLYLALLHREQVSTHREWPTVEAFYTWLADYDPFPQGTPHAVEVLARMHRPDLLAWAVNDPGNQMALSPELLVKALIETVACNDTPSAQALLSGISREALNSFLAQHTQTHDLLFDHRRFYEKNINPFTLTDNTMMVLAQAVLDKGADVNPVDLHGQTLLMGVVAMGGVASLVQGLLKAGANVHALDDEGNNVLNVAAYCNSVATLKVLLDAGANATNINHRGRTALMQIAASDMVASDGKMDLLLPLIDPHAQDDEGTTALKEALGTYLLLTRRNGEVHHTDRTGDVHRLMDAMSPDVVKAVLLPFQGQSSRIAEWFENAVQREAIVLQTTLVDSGDHEARDSPTAPRRRL